jgi:hypothetical protein
MTQREFDTLAAVYQKIKELEPRVGQYSITLEIDLKESIEPLRELLYRACPQPFERFGKL